MTANPVNLNGFDTNLAGAFVELKLPGLRVRGEVRAAWLKPTKYPGVLDLVLMIEVDELEGGAPPASVGEVVPFCYSPEGPDKLIVLHDEPKKRNRR